MMTCFTSACTTCTIHNDAVASDDRMPEIKYIGYTRCCSFLVRNRSVCVYWGLLCGQRDLNTI